jgi:hypothetical protein
VAAQTTFAALGSHLRAAVSFTFVPGTANVPYKNNIGITSSNQVLFAIRKSVWNGANQSRWISYGLHARTEPVFTQRRMPRWHADVRQTPLAIPLCVRFPSHPHQHFLRDLGTIGSA